ncbi:MAG: SH3 domain-containing protein [Anaerolineae bacterium]|nr:SH3 domain-containing protein [Anaerolineae bacterium]
MIRRALRRLPLVLACLALAAPVHAQDQLAALTTAQVLNVRTGPSETYDIIAGLPYGTPVALHARSADGFWLLVEGIGAYGWVSAYYVQPGPGVSFDALPVSTETVAPGSAPPAQSPQPPAAAPAGSAVTTTALRLRAGPGEDHDTIAVLPGGAALTPGETSADGYWVRVTTPEGLSGWVSTCCVAEGSAPDEAGDAAPDDMAQALWRLGAPAWAVNQDFYSIGARTREIYLSGLAMGRNPRAFSKFGDCNSRTVFFLSQFDRGQYNLGPYQHLQPTIDHFAGSFARESMTVWGGGTSWMVFDSLWANTAYCGPDETPVACEFRLHNPGFAVIGFGTKEMGHTQLFTESLRALVEYAINAGVVPILSTKADSLEGEGQYNNDIIRQVAAEYGVPLLEWGKIAAALPGDGLWEDGHHLGWFPPYYNDSRAYYTGHSARNLAVLITLDAVWRGAMQ